MRVGWLGWLALLASCADHPAQLLVFIDTDAVLPGQLAADPTLSAAAMIDTVRVEVLDANGTAYDSRDLARPDPGDWPLSFGFPTSSGLAGTARLRIVLFQISLATVTRNQSGEAIEPSDGAKLERFVETPLPASGERAVEVFLTMDCLAVPSGYTDTRSQPRHTCVDRDHQSAPPGFGIAPLSDVASLHTRVGSWPGARALPCIGPPRPGAVCVPGGFSILGDAQLLQNDPDLSYPTTPLRPVLLSPFWMDLTEVTVARMRDLLDAHPGLQPPMGPDQSSVDGDCIWSGSADPRLPVNCISWDAARAACLAQGGDLPTEARWEHAARGRGQQRRYPWGDSPPACCSASAFRASVLGPGFCSGEGVEPVGAHPVSGQCPDADLSRDGILDLAGSVGEAQLDFSQLYDAPCWSQPGVLQDPICNDSTQDHLARGGDWSSSFEAAAAAYRRTYAPGPASGFRCVYEDVP